MNPLVLLLIGGAAVVVAKGAKGATKRRLHPPKGVLRCYEKKDKSRFLRRVVMVTNGKRTVELPSGTRMAYHYEWPIVGAEPVPSCFGRYGGPEGTEFAVATVRIGWDNGNQGNDILDILEYAIKPLTKGESASAFFYVEELLANQLCSPPKDCRYLKAFVRELTFGVPGKQDPDSTAPLGLAYREVEILHVYRSKSDVRGGAVANLGTWREVAEWIKLGMEKAEALTVEFNEDGNRIKILDTCDVLVGSSFLPGGDVNAIERDTLEKTLAVPNNTAWGYVDYLLSTMNVDVLGVDRVADIIAKQILIESETPQGDARYPDAPCDLTYGNLKPFYEWLVGTIRPWVAEHGGGIGFG